MTAVQDDRTITIQDPRNFDGDPYQVAERAIAQLGGVIKAAQDIYEPTMLMVRNADLERSLAADVPLDEIAPSWPESPQGRSLSKIADDLGAIQLRLIALHKAAGYNPRAR